MAIATGTAIAMGVVAAAGAIAGSQAHKSHDDTSSGVDAGSATNFENFGQNEWQQNTQQLQDEVNAGPGTQDVTNAYNSNTGLASMLQQYSQGGFQPTGQDVTNANSYSDSLFGQQRTQLQQSYVDQTNSANQAAAAMGRDPNDPILQAKLRTGQNNQMAQLNAAQGSYAAQYAQQMPGLRLGYAEQANGVLNGLASQAMSNRQALAGMGQGIMQNQQNFRLATATRWGKQDTSSGGGLAGGIQGGIAGAGAAMGAAGGISSLTGSGAGAMTNGVPAATMANVNSNAFSNSLQMPSFGSQYSGGGGYGFGVGQ